MIGLITNALRSNTARAATAGAGALWGKTKGFVSTFDSGGTLKGLGIGTAASIILPGTPEEKMENIKVNAAMWYLTMGMKNPARQAVWTTLAMLAPYGGDLVRGLVSAQRGVEASRTSAAIPFAHSTIAMDQAMMSLQYASTRLNSAYAGTASQAAMYAAKYMQR